MTWPPSTLQYQALISFRRLVWNTTCASFVGGMTGPPLLRAKLILLRRRSRYPLAMTWPSLPLAEWRDTRDTLHMWMQIVGKTRLALAPPENHWWHVTLYVSARGLITSSIPYRSRAFDVEFDFIDHRLVVNTSDGSTPRVALRP